MIDQTDMMTVVEKYRGDAVVIPVFQANKRWVEVSNHKTRDISVGGAMGKSSSFALGLALAQPDVNVILFDGDGSLAMNLGSLVTIAGQLPKNLYHFVLQNGMYATTGGQPIPGTNSLSFTDLAKAAGYAASYDFDDLEDFATNAERILNEPGPVFVCLRTIPEIRTMEQRAAQRADPNRRTAMETIADLREELGTA